MILAEDVSYIHYRLRKIDEKYKNWGLITNPYKTVYLIAENSGYNFTFRDTEIKHRDNYQYLGVTITNDGYSAKKIASRVNEGSACLRQLNGILWSRNVSRDTKLRIYKTIVGSVVKYGAECG